MNDIKRASSPPSGRFVLRIDPGLHATLREAAREAGVSLNDYCARKLAAPGADVTGPAADVVSRASTRLRAALLGVVAFGSWARDDLAEGSDVDVLVVVDANVEIVRSLYRSWDEQPVTWDGRRVEVHFVHLPNPDGPPSGLWAEAAVDGVVLFERDFVVSRRLAAVRRRIASGAVSRKRVHGQPYWVRGS